GRHRGRALALVRARGVAREAQAARPAEARGLPRLGLEPLIEIAAVLGQTREVLGRPQLADEAGGVPRGAAGDVAALQQEHVAPAELGEVVGDAAAGDAPADDDDARVRRECDPTALPRPASGYSAAGTPDRRSAPARPPEARSRGLAPSGPSGSRRPHGTGSRRPRPPSCRSSRSTR